MKYIIIETNTIYTIKNDNPHGPVRDLLIDAQLNGLTVKKVEG